MEEVGEVGKGQGRAEGPDRNLKGETGSDLYLPQGLSLTFSDRLSLTIHTQVPHSFLRSTPVNCDHYIFISINS